MSVSALKYISFSEKWEMCSPHCGPYEKCNAMKLNIAKENRNVPVHNKITHFN